MAVIMGTLYGVVCQAQPTLLAAGWQPDQCLLQQHLHLLDSLTACQSKKLILNQKHRCHCHSSTCTDCMLATPPPPWYPLLPLTCYDHEHMKYLTAMRDWNAELVQQLNTTLRTMPNLYDVGPDGGVTPVETHERIIIPPAITDEACLPVLYSNPLRGSLTCHLEMRAAEAHKLSLILSLHDEYDRC